MRVLALRGVGLLLALSSVSKLRNPHMFWKALNGYELFPDSALEGLVYLVPSLELVAGLALSLLLSRGAQLWAVILFGAFSFSLGWARWHDLTLACGCFGRFDSWLHRQPYGLTLHLLGCSGTFIWLTRELWRSQEVGKASVD